MEMSERELERDERIRARGLGARLMGAQLFPDKKERG
jgi:hypothetical protein